MVTYHERQVPVTIPADLVADLWRQALIARDDARQAARKFDELTALLERMKAAGMCNHLPTPEEVQAAWRGD